MLKKKLIFAIFFVGMTLSLFNGISSMRTPALWLNFMVSVVIADYLKRRHPLSATIPISQKHYCGRGTRSIYILVYLNMAIKLTLGNISRPMWQITNYIIYVFGLSIATTILPKTLYPEDGTQRRSDLSFCRHRYPTNKPLRKFFPSSCEQACGAFTQCLTLSLFYSATVSFAFGFPVLSRTANLTDVDCSVLSVISLCQLDLFSQIFEASIAEHIRRVIIIIIINLASKVNSNAGI